ncbi:MAG: isoprenylcysteine carboxylmethyltransferase family protein [Candidatus Eremiobacteraeota bacterium]|nr:isoprenylcysteine carboxylmethyltransferase family protein [Candidatus Eremiobacteraeota bacterium]MBV8283215.1 isoprenylcysteine carboxylmethyltransferase family protein [Candidatus Eremiobacteraeota bacterium]MBV8333627.1 isoprenylcysteine carboxylmethyltransferase family protein [Candidatus Eremiobacteraeota bacterium]MBV8435370.1 isoprenylcysteine carboxylmethyltransferase family protein [Candidatus Eremiobacteraeota bacterium]
MPDLDPATEWTVLGCWLLFVAVWLIGWIYNLLRAPRIERRRLSPSVIVGAVIVYAISWCVPTRVWDALWVDSAPLRYAGIVLVLAGTGFAMWARVTLGTMWTGAPAQRAGHRLCTTGPFALARHPIYTGFLTMLIGTACACGLGSWTGPVVAGAIALFFKIRDEEKLMHETFGSQYDAYRARVPALIPLPRLR